MKLGFVIDVIEGDALNFQSDVLMIKYSPNSGGLDSKVRRILKKNGHPDYHLGVGEFRLISSPQSIASREILIVGTTVTSQLDYQEIRALGYNMLTSLHELKSKAQQVVTTVHGVRTGLRNDEVEAFRSLLLGFADAFDEGKVPPSLEQVTIIEHESHRAQLFQEVLNKFISPREEEVEEAVRDTAQDLQQTLAGIESFNEDYQRPVADESTPHIFVAMPFADTYDDHYYLAIRPAITDNGLLCVRLDQGENTFTGDIMEQVKNRIKAAKLVIALLDSSNPNVYLEVGYAWGVGTPTLLILHRDENTPFDVQGSRILYYSQMYKLKQQLIDEIRNLL